MEDQKLSSEQEDVKMAGESVSRQAEKGNGPEREDAYLALLLKMAMRRKHTPHPDVDEEWTRLMARHSNNPKVFRMRKMNPFNGFQMLHTNQLSYFPRGDKIL